MSLAMRSIKWLAFLLVLGVSGKVVLTEDARLS
jgi:hypothetical protein